MIGIWRKLVVLGLLLVPAAGAVAGESFDSGRWLTYYYADPRPEDFVRAVRALDESGLLDKKTAEGPIVVALGQIMAQNPGRIARWTEELKDVRERHGHLFSGILWYSATPEGNALLRRYAAKADLDDLFSKPPVPVYRLAPVDPGVLDMNWGYFMATGDRRAVTAIIRALSYADDRGEPVRAGASDKAAERKRLLRKMTARAARWSLTSNAVQHDRVMEILEEEAEDATGDLRDDLREIVATARRQKARLRGAGR